MMILSILSLSAALVCALAGIVRAVRRKPCAMPTACAGALALACAFCLGLSSGGETALLLPVLLLWLYLTATMMIMGAEFNGVLMELRGQRD